MDEDPFFCENCDHELSHDEIETVAPVPQLDIDSYAPGEGVAEVYQCGGCGLVIGFDQQ